jgi:hypothetical protein
MYTFILKLMRHIWLSMLFLPLLLVGLPLAGVMLQGKPLAVYLEFPPLTVYVKHAPFSWTAFLLLALLPVLVLVPLIRRLLSYSGPVLPLPRHPFPWWGYVGFLLTPLAWLLAWTRFDWFAVLQPYTFFPLWLGFIISINSLTLTRTGSCLLVSRTRFFFVLFPLSALFWWFFEYLNRFVQNWHYLGVEDFTTSRYVLHATLCFSTVLPAVLSTEELLGSFPRLTGPLQNWFRISVRNPQLWGWLLLLPAAPALMAISIYPDFLFPMLWMAPFLIITGVQLLCSEATLFRDIKHGDWRLIWLPALAALVCGFFWELWNVNSLAHWEYSVPFVQRFHVFEMPLLGYAGYLPFGLECMVIGRMLERVIGNKKF